MSSLPRRRWFQFSLATMLVVVAVVAFCVWELNWILQRRKVIARSDVDPEISAVLTEDAEYFWELPRPKPLLLRLLREPTYAHLYVAFEPRSGDWKLTPEQDQEFRRLMKLFPEAHVQLNVHMDLRFLPPDLEITPPAQNPPEQDDPFNP